MLTLIMPTQPTHTLLKPVHWTSSIADATFNASRHIIYLLASSSKTFLFFSMTNLIDSSHAFVHLILLGNSFSLQMFNNTPQNKPSHYCYSNEVYKGFYLHNLPPKTTTTTTKTTKKNKTGKTGTTSPFTGGSPSTVGGI